MKTSTEHFRLGLLLPSPRKSQYVQNVELLTVFRTESMGNEHGRTNMPCHRDCTKCGEQQDCSLEDDERYPVPSIEMIYYGKDLCDLSQP